MTNESRNSMSSYVSIATSLATLLVIVGGGFWWGAGLDKRLTVMEVLVQNQVEINRRLVDSDESSKKHIDDIRENQNRVVRTLDALTIKLDEHMKKP